MNRLVRSAIESVNDAAAAAAGNAVDCLNDVAVSAAASAIDSLNAVAAAAAAAKSNVSPTPPLAAAAKQFSGECFFYPHLASDELTCFFFF